MWVRYWRVEESFVMGRTRALGWKDVLAMHWLEIRKRREQRRRK
jgi:hypothetical protein